MRKYPKAQRTRSIHAHGLEQGQFKPQTIRHRRPRLEDPMDILLDEGEDLRLDDENLLDPDWDL